MINESVTVAQDNTQSIRQYLQWRRMYPDMWNEYRQERIQEMLEARRLYRSDTPIKVWVVDSGDGYVVLLEEEFLQYLEDNDDPDMPVIWRNETMTGREFGRLPLWED